MLHAIVLFDRDSFTRVAEDQGLQVISFAYTQGAPFWAASVLNELRLLGWVKISRERLLIYHPLRSCFRPYLPVLISCVARWPACRR